MQRRPMVVGRVATGAASNHFQLTRSFTMSAMDTSGDPEREHALADYKKKLIDSREWEAKLKALRLEIKGLQHDYDVSEDNIKALQSVGQIIGEVLKQLDEERCGFCRIVVAPHAP